MLANTRDQPSEWGRGNIRLVLVERPRNVADVDLGQVSELAEGVGRKVEIAEGTRLANIGQLDGDGLVIVWS